MLWQSLQSRDSFQTSAPPGGNPVAYVVAEPCIGTKSRDCFEVCPVDAIHPRPDEAGFDSVNQVFIDPSACIDCAACEPVCPVQAIFHETEVPPQWSSFTAANRNYFGGK